MNASPELLPFSALVARPLRRWMLKPYLRQGAIAMVWGETGKGKTFVMLDFACTVALDRSWCGLRTTGGLVVYVAAEGEDDVADRVKAQAQYLGVTPDDFRNRFFVLDKPVNLVRVDRVDYSDGEIGELASAINDLPTPPVLIVIDPLNFCMKEGKENDNGDMTKAVDSMKKLQALVTRRAFGWKPTILFVHHTGRSGTGPRGAYASETSADATFEIGGHETGRITLEHIKARSTRRGAALVFRLVEVQIGEDEDGDPYTSAVAQFENIAAFVEKVTGRKQRRGRASVTAERAKRVLEILKQGPAAFSELKRALSLKSAQLTRALTAVQTQTEVRPDGRYQLASNASNGNDKAA